MNVFLIRHAHAGHRGGGNRDIYRPLTDTGLGQADAVARALRKADVGVVASSTATRCVQTVEPIAKELGVDVLESDDLWEDASTRDALAFITKHAADGVVISSHGNIIPNVVSQLADNGMNVKGRGCSKGSVWALTYSKKNGFVSARYFDTDEFDDLVYAIKRS